MVWACITHDQRTEFMIVQGNLTCQSYIDKILRPLVVQFAQCIGRNFEFQDNNASPHRARIVFDFLRQQGVRALPCRTKSHDMLPIEHITRGIPVSILYKSIADRYRPVRVADGPITARCRFIKNASWDGDGYERR